MNVDGPGIYRMSRNSARLINREDTLVDQHLGRPLCKVVWNWARTTFVIGLHLKKALHRVGLFIRIDHVVVPPAQKKQVLESVALGGALLGVVSSAARPCPLDVTDLANNCGALE